MDKQHNDVNEDSYNTLRNVSYKISKELLKDGFSEDSIYTFLHKTVGIGLYEAQIDVELNNIN